MRLSGLVSVNMIKEVLLKNKASTGPDVKMINTRDTQREHNRALNPDFTSSDAISSKSTVLSLSI